MEERVCGREERSQPSSRRSEVRWWNRSTGMSDCRCLTGSGRCQERPAAGRSRRESRRVRNKSLELLVRAAAPRSLFTVCPAGCWLDAFLHGLRLSGHPLTVDAELPLRVLTGQM